MKAKTETINIEDDPSLVLTHWDYYITLLNIFAMHFEKTPTNISEYMSNSIFMMGKFNYWLESKLMKELPEDKDIQGYIELLEASLSWLNIFL